MDTGLFYWLRIILVALLVGIIYTTWAKIPSRQKQREEAERIIARRITGDYAEARREFQNYFSGIFKLLTAVALAFLAVNVLIALVINVFIMSQPNDPVFIKVSDWLLPPMVVATAMAFMMCSAGWMMVVSFFYHNRAVKLSLETKYDDFFNER